jgi:protoheme IX farnesyltransferase
MSHPAVDESMPDQASPAAPSAPADSWVSDLSALIKLRLSFLVVCTTLVGYLLGRGFEPIAWGLMAITLTGTALSACGASALNQWLEREWDSKMLRTQNRPLPAGRMHSEDALLFGILFSVLGVVALAVFVNATSAWLTLATVLIYVGVYTPLKRITELNTLVGAIPGALPPLIGWTAATGDLGLGGWLLFAILFFWQMPHFLAIAWIYRKEYKDAGFVMLTGRDPTGAVTGRQSVTYAFCLLVISMLPTMIGLTGLWYFAGAFVLGGAFLAAAIGFAIDRSDQRARQLFFASIIYLPLLLILLVSTPASR